MFSKWVSSDIADSPRFADSELDAVLEQLEDDNHIMFRDWVIHRI